MKRIILHLFSDQKVVSRDFKNYKEFIPDYEHIGILFLGNSEKPKYVSNIKEFKIYNPSLVKSFDFSKVACVKVHFLSDEKVKFIFSIPKTIPVWWNVYGGDLYNRYLQYMGYKLYYTDKVFQTIKKQLTFPLKKIIREIEYWKITKRVKYYSAIDCDYQLIKLYSKHARKSINLPLFSYPMEDIMGNLYNSTFKDGNSIIIGNSASYTNNHLYCLNYLKKIDLTKHQTVLQLAYGGDKKYNYEVKIRYQEDLKCPVIANEEFLPLDAFNKSLQNAHAFIFGNWRQEAVGNILTAFYLGKKVFLSNKSPLLNYFRQKGFTVYELETLDMSILDELPQHIKEKNRTLCDQLYSIQRLKHLMQDAFKEIINE